MAALNWGLLGTGPRTRRFALDLRSQGLPLHAVAGADAAAARALAGELCLDRHVGAYADLLDDPGVDIVHVAPGDGDQAGWSRRALEAGKHVVCEPPAAPTGAGLQAVLAAARQSGRFFMEGFAYRCHPVWNQVRAWIAEGRLGEVRLLRSSYCLDLGDAAAGAGGALGAAGSYCLSFSRLLAGAEPQRAFATAQDHPRGSDGWLSATLRFPTGAVATFDAALRVPAPPVAMALGTGGWLEIPSPWHPDRERALARLVRGNREETLACGDGLPPYARLALHALAHLDAGEAPAMPWSDSLGQARALETLRASLEGE